MFLCIFIILHSLILHPSSSLLLLLLLDYCNEKRRKKENFYELYSARLNEIIVRENIKSLTKFYL